MTPPGLAIELGEDRLGLGRDGTLERGDVVGIGPDHVPAEILKRMRELIDRTAVELLRGDEFVAGLQQAVKRQHLRRVSGGGRKAGGAAFERGDALLQHRGGRVADAGIDVAEGLQPEQRGGMIDVFKHVRRGLIDRRRPRAGGRIGLGAGMDRERGEARDAFAHEAFLRVILRGRRGGKDASGVKDRPRPSRRRTPFVGARPTRRWCVIAAAKAGRSPAHARAGGDRIARSARGSRSDNWRSVRDRG